MSQFYPIFRVFSLLLLFPPLFSQAPDPALFKNLSFRFIGPDGNRAIAIAGEPGNPMVNYIGAASGGLWKTDDGGTTWNPVFDDQDVSSVGSIALAPSDPKQVWVGTGETFLIRPAHAMGEGIFKSADAGKTWKKMGLEKTGRIGRIVVHPANPDIVYAAALGHAYGPQEERGVYRTLDGGKTWDRVLFVDSGTGAADIAMDPLNPDNLYVGMWSIHINTWGLNSGGPGGGIYRSRDGGNTWESLHSKGLPGGVGKEVGKTAVALCHSQPNVVYALFEIESPALYRSKDYGETWELMTRDHSINERAPYYTRITVAPDNPEEIYFINVRFGQSFDGGKTLEKRPPRGGGDNHDMWIDPLNPARMMVAHDGCASVSLNRGKTFQRVVLPIAQMYHVAVDDQIPYYVYGNRQDGYSYRGPSNSRQSGIPLGLWQGVGGCESGFAKPDPFDNNIIFSGCYDGGLERHDLRTGHSRDVRVWPEAGYGWAPAEMKYRWHWNFPLSFSPHTPHRVYTGSQFVHQSDDGGESWQIISTDLTLNIKSHQQSSGGVATDNLMTYDGATLFAIEESTLQPGEIWVGTNDGQVQLTRNFGKTWTNLTPNLAAAGLPEWGTISCISPSLHVKGTAYITVDMHQMGDFGSYVYKTENYGNTWKNIGESLPQTPHGFAHVVKEDPKMPGLLYLGVDNGLWVSFHDGSHWMRLRNNLPPAPVYWLEIQKRFDDLVIGTYGRGFYILDDISFLREYAQIPDPTAAALLPLRPAYRFNTTEGVHSDGGFNNGQNPAYGANLDYLLPDSTGQPVAVAIIDQAGNLVRRLEGKQSQGIHRLQWDLRYDSPRKPKLRTQPPGKTWVAFNEQGWRPLLSWDLDLMMGQVGPKVVPGWYTIRLTVGDENYEQTLEVKKDPHSEAKLGDIQKQVTQALALKDALNQCVSLIDDIEWVRKEMAEKFPLIKSAKPIEWARRLQDMAFYIAGRLYDVNLTGAREDAFRSPMQLYGRLSALASDLAKAADFSPTSQQLQVFEQFKTQLEEVQKDFDQLTKVDLPELNKQLKKQGVQLNWGAAVKP